MAVWISTISMASGYFIGDITSDTPTEISTDVEEEAGKGNNNPLEQEEVEKDIFNEKNLKMHFKATNRLVLSKIHQQQYLYLSSHVSEIVPPPPKS